MKKILMFFTGILLLLISFAALYFSSALFDASEKRSIKSFVFQPNDLSVNRVGRPVPIDELSDTYVREKLIKKFVTEYFYISPDPESLAIRTRPDSIMAALSSPEVFKNWRKGEAQKIEEVSDNKVLRHVSFNEIVQKEGSDYWEVHYELKTWEKPNIMDLKPKLTEGVMYLKIEFEKKLRNMRAGKDFDIGEYLKNGGDPAAIFNFMVTEVQ